MLINGNGTDVLDVKGSSKCPANCIVTDISSQADVAVLPESGGDESRLATFFRCICNDKTPSGANRVTPPIVVTIGLDSLQLKTIAAMSTDQFNGVEINGFKLGHDDSMSASMPSEVILSGFHHDDSTDPFGRTVRRFVSINLASGGVRHLFDKYQQCPHADCGVQDIPFSGFGLSLQAGSGESWPSAWVDAYFHAFTNGTLEKGLFFAGIGLKDGKTIFNGTVGVGLWSIAQSLDSNIYGIGICCDPADGTRNCPKECNGTSADLHKVVLLEFPDAIKSPSNFHVKWTGSLEDLGIMNSLTSGAAFDASTRTYYHMVIIKDKGHGVLRIQDHGDAATALPPWILPSGQTPLAIRFRHIPETSASFFA
jgi:hypothetical protein